MKRNTSIFAALVVATAFLAFGCGGSGGGGSGGGGSGGIVGGSPHLAITTQPLGAAPGAQLAQQPVVEVRDAQNQLVSSDNTTTVTAAIMGGTGAGGATLGGTTTVTVSGGRATFTNLSISLAGSGYRLTFTSVPAVTSVNSGAFDVVMPGVADHLTITTQPAGGAPATAFTTQPVVEVRDTANQLVSGDNTTLITAAITSGTGTAGAVLQGTTSLTVTNGRATFTHLAIDLGGSGYTLTFTSAPALTSASSSPFSVVGGGGSIITPGTPPSSQATFTIRSDQGVKPISRWIYGKNGISFGQRPANLTLGRSGGNRLTCYNWENNASNAGTDWLNQNDWLLGQPTDPVGYAATSMIDDNRSHNVGSLITVPCAGYVAADHGHLNSQYPVGDVNQTTNYLAVRFKLNKAKKGSAFSLTPSTTDGDVYQDEFVNFIKNKYPTSANDPVRPVFYSLDNEPDLWGSTHPRIRGAATGSTGSGPTYAEMLQRTRDFADAIKDVEPNAVVFGPVNYGWQGMVDLQNASDAAGRDFHTYYLQQLAAAEVTYGQRLVDVLDIHWYPEAGANDGNGTWTRITSDNADPLVAAARMQAPRSLWDTTYTEDSWITQWSTQGPIRLLPRIQDKINAHYPGTKIGITEYNYGGGGHISGGIAQADFLGVLGREGVFAATLWTLSSSNDYIWGGFEMFRNFDGANGSFGDTSIQAQNSDGAANTSVYASVDASNPNRVVIVCINKTNSARTAGIQLWHTVQFSSAEVYRLTSSGSQPVKGTDITLTQTNAFQYSMPANSVTTIVMRP